MFAISGGEASLGRFATFSSERFRPCCGKTCTHLRRAVPPCVSGSALWRFDVGGVSLRRSSRAENGPERDQSAFPSVALVALTGFAPGLGLSFPILTKRTTDVIGFLESACMVATHIPLVASRVDQLTLRRSSLGHRLFSPFSVARKSRRPGLKFVDALRGVRFRQGLVEYFPGLPAQCLQVGPLRVGHWLVTGFPLVWIALERWLVRIALVPHKTNRSQNTRQCLRDRRCRRRAILARALLPLITWAPHRSGPGALSRGNAARSCGPCRLSCWVSSAQGAV